jgi:flagellum-specific peptidoglycan hydrolase FlgJ
MSIGKTMYQHEQEAPNGASMIPSTARSKKAGGQKANYKPIRSFGSNDEMALGSLLHQIWVRLRPTLASLKYRWYHTTKQKNLVKIGVLVALGYFVFFSDKGFLGNSGQQGIEGASIFDTDNSTGEKKARKTKYKSPNAAAPVSASELFAQEAKAYIEEFAGVAQKEQAAHGIPASISLAQGLIESRAGTSKLAKGNNNHFGMKCFSRNCKKGHCSNFTDDTHKDFFRKYQDPMDSWKDHSRMLSKGRYAKLKRFGSNYREWAYGLKSIGYATDRTYAEKLIGVIERYDLHKFDR